MWLFHCPFQPNSESSVSQVVQNLFGWTSACAFIKNVCTYSSANFPPIDSRYEAIIALLFSKLIGTEPIVQINGVYFLKTKWNFCFRVCWSSIRIICISSALFLLLLALYQQYIQATHELSNTQYFHLCRLIGYRAIWHKLKDLVINDMLWLQSNRL